MINRPVTRPSNVKSSDGLGPEIRVFELIETARWHEKKIINYGNKIKKKKKLVQFNGLSFRYLQTQFSGTRHTRPVGYQKEQDDLLP